MKLLSNLVQLLLLLFFIDFINSNEFISVIEQKCYGTCNKKYCNISILCRPFNRTKKLSSMDFYFHPGVILNAPINVEVVAYKKFRTVYRQFMMKLNMELCAQLNRTDHPYFKKALQNDVDGNILDPCPLRGHRYVKPHIPKHDHFPLVPVGEWRVDHILSKTINNSNEFIASWSNFFELKPTTTLEF